MPSNDSDIFVDRPSRTTSPAPAAARKKKDESPTSFGNLLGAAYEPALTMGSGFLGSIPAGLAGIAGGVLPGPPGQAGDFTRGVQNALTYRPRTVGGQNAMTVIGAPFEALGHLAKGAGNLTQDNLTGTPLEFAAPALATQAETAINLIPGILGARYMPPITAAPPMNFGGVLSGARSVVNSPETLLRVAGRTGQAIFGSAEGNASRLGAHVVGEERLPGVVANLRNAQPGETAGQAALPAGSAEFSALQEIVAQRDPSKYGTAGIAGEQEAARTGVLQGIAGTPRELELMKGRRSLAANINYGEAFANAVKADPELLSIVQNPFFADALPDAVRLAGAKGITPKNDLTQFLHYVKISLDKQLAKTGETALATTEKSAVQGLQGELTNWLGTKNPDYAMARNAYMGDSGPINRAETGQELLSSLRNTLGTTERPSTFSNAVAKAQQEPSIATGKPRWSDLTPQDQATVRNVVSELARDSRLQTMATEGMPEAARRIGFSMPTAPTTGFLNAKITIARSMLNHLSGRATDKALKFLADNMDNPQVMAEVLGQQLPGVLSPGRQALGQFPLYGGASAGILSTRE